MNLATKQFWLLISGIFYIIQTNNTNNYTHGFPDTSSSRTLTFILPLDVLCFECGKMQLLLFIYVYHHHYRWCKSVLLQVEMLQQHVSFFLIEERIKVKCRCGGSQKKSHSFSTVWVHLLNCRYGVYLLHIRIINTLQARTYT